MFASYTYGFIVLQFLRMNSVLLPVHNLWVEYLGSDFFLSFRFHFNSFFNVRYH